MIPTPETDANLHEYHHAFESMQPNKNGDWVHSDFARRLERQRDTMAAALRELSELPLPGAADEIIEAALAAATSPQSS
jgi:hypothetical protein